MAQRSYGRAVVFFLGVLAPVVLFQPLAHEAAHCAGAWSRGHDGVWVITLQHPRDMLGGHDPANARPGYDEDHVWIFPLQAVVVVLSLAGMLVVMLKGEGSPKARRGGKGTSRFRP